MRKLSLLFFLKFTRSTQRGPARGAESGGKGRRIEFIRDPIKCERAKGGVLWQKETANLRARVASILSP